MTGPTADPWRSEKEWCRGHAARDKGCTKHGLRSLDKTSLFFMCFFSQVWMEGRAFALKGVDSEARYLSWMFVALREIWRILGCAGHACSFIDLFLISDLLLTSYKIEGVDGSSDIWIHLICLLWLFLPEPMGFQIWPEQTIDIFLFHLGGWFFVTKEFEWFYSDFLKRPTTSVFLKQ